MLLWNKLALECAGWCCTSATRDVTTVACRSKHEGLSFLTITLPSFGKDFERSLDLGYVDHTLFAPFGFQRGLPRFLGGFLDLIFDRTTGVLLDTPSLVAIRSVRQLTLMFGKILLPCSASREAAAITGYVQCEQEIAWNRGSQDLDGLADVGSRLFGPFFSRIDSDIYSGKLDPKHGPGSTSDNLIGNQKFDQKTWPLRLEEYFPYGEMCLPNWSHWDQLDKVDFLEPEAEVPVTVISVPKTMKTPRIIAKEPTAMQYAQQSVLSIIRDHLDKGSTPFSSLIGIDDQEPNQLLALEGSREGSLATLDLSEASDRVSMEHVAALLENHPHFREAVFSCRSTKALLPTGDLLDLCKFASMGSALTFPLEAMVFLAIILLAVEKSLGRPLTYSELYALRGKVRVYGDDIIVPVEYVHSVRVTLESFGLKVNSTKSFWTGMFRESCGKEYYGGTDVSIVRVRRSFPLVRKDAQEIVSLSSLRNQLYELGYVRTCEWLDDRLTSLLRHYPIVGPNSPVIGRVDGYGPLVGSYVIRHGVPMVKGYLVRVKIPHNEISNLPALYKCLSLLEKRDSPCLPAREEPHLLRSGRPRVVDIKLGYGIFNH